MNNKWVNCMAVCSLCLVFTGCGQRERKISLTELQNSSGDFQFSSVQWGSSKEDIEETLGVTLDEFLSANSSHQAYMASEAFEWEGAQARLLCEFENEALSSVSFHIFPEEDEQEAVWEALTQELTSLYGEAEIFFRESQIEELGFTTQGESYLWERTEGIHTALVLTDFKQDGSFKYILLSVYPVTK